MLTLNKILIKLQQAELFFPALVFNFNLLKISFLLQPDMNEDVGFFLRSSYPHSHTHTHIHTPTMFVHIGETSKESSSRNNAIKAAAEEESKDLFKKFPCSFCL